MTLLKKCPNCKTYTIKELCPNCKTKTESAHYKFKKVRDAPPRDFKRR
ncbi:MAG: nucleolar RNA-binding Nop10p family protein [archaeon]